MDLKGIMLSEKKPMSEDNIMCNSIYRIHSPSTKIIALENRSVVARG